MFSIRSDIMIAMSSVRGNGWLGPNLARIATADSEMAARLFFFFPEDA